MKKYLIILIVLFAVVYFLFPKFSHAQTAIDCGLNFSDCNVSTYEGLIFVQGQCQGAYSPCEITINTNDGNHGTIINYDFTANPTYQDTDVYQAWIQCYDNENNNLGALTTSWTSNAPLNGGITYDPITQTGYEFINDVKINQYRPCNWAEINVTDGQTVTFYMLLTASSSSPLNETYPGNIVYGIAIIIFIVGLFFWDFMWKYLMPK